MTINQAKDGMSSCKGFFTVSLNQIDQIVYSGGGSEEIICYLIICRGLGKSGYSTWGRKSCEKYTMMTYHSATKRVEWLLANNFISTRTNPLEKAVHSKPMFLISTGESEIALANVLIEGVAEGKNNPPIKRIGQLGLGSIGGREEAQLDVLMVLLHLYKHEIIADYGGIDPTSGLYRCWQACENAFGDMVSDIDGTNLGLHEVEGGVQQVYLKFAEEALFYVADSTERSERFWQAFKTLKTKLGWIYETTQIWTADPRKNPRAQPLYTLYVHDKKARVTDPYLSSDIHSALFKLGMLDRQLEFCDPDPDIGFKNSGRFRFVAEKKKGGFPIGIYRLRFRPHTRDTGKGIQLEKDRVESWRAYLKSLR